jgi:type IV pilus assembly protein PilB
LDKVQGADFVQGKGCYNCMDKGYKGRTGIFEVLVIDEMIQEMILRRASSQEIMRTAKESGHLRTLKDDATRKVLDGETTLDEAVTAVMM